MWMCDVQCADGLKLNGITTNGQNSNRSLELQGLFAAFQRSGMLIIVIQILAKEHSVYCF